MVNKIVFITSSVLLLATTLVIMLYTQAENYNNIGGILIGLNISITLFSINFSFLEYQFSSYKNLLNVSKRLHTGLSLFLLFISFTPLLVLTFYKDFAGKYALSLLPIVAWGSFCISLIVSKESKGVVILNKHCSKKKLKKYLPSFVKKIDHAISVPLVDETDFELGSPSHEWSIAQKTFIQTDDSESPLDLNLNIALIAYKNNDVQAMIHSIKLIISYYEILDEVNFEKCKNEKHKIQNSIKHNLNESLLRIVNILIREDYSNTYLIRIQQELILIFNKKVSENKQNLSTTQFFFGVIAKISVHFLGENLENYALLSITMARQAVRKGICHLETNGKKETDRFFEDNLQTYIDHIKQIGIEAIRLKNSSFLYRCLDALGWEGCDSVKCKKTILTESCIGALVQLGRESRAANLKCFWDRCAKLPHEHVFERLEWILSWISINDDSPNSKLVINYLEIGFSRLIGKDVELSINEHEKNLNARITDKPHKLEYLDGYIKKTLDYSDPNMLTDFAPLTSSFFRGPAVPFEGFE